MRGLTPFNLAVLYTDARHALTEWGLKLKIKI